MHVIRANRLSYSEITIDYKLKKLEQLSCPVWFRHYMMIR